MGTGAHETVEFLDLLPGASTSGPSDDLVDHTGAPRRRGWGVLGALVVVAGVLTAARVLGAPPPVAPAEAAEPPVFGTEVLLPDGFGAPAQMATAPEATGDVVWVLGANGQVVRVVDGVVAAASPGTGYDALAVRPDGRAVFVSTGRLAPAVVALDPVTLEPGDQVFATAPVTVLASGADEVWGAAGGAVEGWSTDLHRALPAMRLPAEVSAVRSLAVVGPRLQAVVTTTPGVTALLRLEPPGGATQLTSAYTGPVSVVPGVPALVAHPTAHRTIEIAVDPSVPGAAPLGRPQSPDASIWPAERVGTATWVVSTRTSASIDCYDPSGQLVGRMLVGDTGHGVAGPVVVTGRAVYAVTTAGDLARGGHASCGVAPRATTGGRRGD